MTEKAKNIIAIMLILVSIISLSISCVLLFKHFINVENEQNLEYRNEMAIKSGVECEINEQALELMYLSTEDNVSLFVARTGQGLYLVGVKYENEKVVYVDVEQKLL